jgi:hypothetical protein
MRKKPRLPIIEETMHSVFGSYALHRKQINAAWLRARRFYLTEDASTKLGKILGATEELILDNHQFAIPPFETMYVELSCKLLYEAAGKWTTATHAIAPEDEWLGFLIDKGRIWVFSRTVADQAGMSPWMFEDGLGHASMQWPKHLTPGWDNLGPVWGRMAVMLGTGLHYLASQETFDEIAARFSIHPSLTPSQVYTDLDTYKHSTGDIRNYLTLLLVLNTPQHITYITNPPTHGLVKGKRITFKGHSVVNIELGKSKNLTKFFHTFTGIKHRRHEVRGHYVHHHININCTHDWPAMPESSIDGIPRWRCRRCRGMRVWRKEHQRGDATLGWVNHTYKVTT